MLENWPMILQINSSRKITKDELTKVLDPKSKLDVIIDIEGLKYLLREIFSEDEVDFIL